MMPALDGSIAVLTLATSEPVHIQIRAQFCAVTHLWTTGLLRGIIEAVPSEKTTPRQIVIF
jgi:hypothetical protein